MLCTLLYAELWSLLELWPTVTAVRHLPLQVHDAMDLFDCHWRVRKHCVPGTRCKHAQMIHMKTQVGSQQTVLVVEVGISKVGQRMTSSACGQACGDMQLVGSLLPILFIFRGVWGLQVGVACKGPAASACLCLYVEAHWSLSAHSYKCTVGRQLRCILGE